LSETRPTPGKPLGFLLALIRLWALLGGFLLLSVVLMTTYSALSGFIAGKPFPGDFELTQMGVAVAAFAFLPYCQLTSSNVTADIFTARAKPATVRLLDRLGSLVALAFSALLIWRTWAGMLDYQQYLEVTTILQIPLWYAFVPVLVSLVLLLIACVITLRYPQASTDSPLNGL